MLKYKDETIGIGKVDLSDYAKTTDNHDYLKGKNVFTTVGAIMGKYLMDDGSLVTNANYSVTDYIEIPSGATHITFSGANAVDPVMCFYDSTKTTVIDAQITGSDGNATVSIPSGASYLRHTVKITDFGTEQIEFNSVATSYEPHIKSNKELSDNILGCIDVANVIKAQTTISASGSVQSLYTATQNCYVKVRVAGNVTYAGLVLIDGYDVEGIAPDSSSTISIITTVPLKKGQTLSARTYGANGHYTIYGMC